ncbi:MAG: YegS/Rv2252/BmrU family lipid kinase [Acidimicrobiia bacterium]|nr:YegS/Rv2252/BmrU family lipid kinase [Acidimicrobiia bacterium]
MSTWQVIVNPSAGKPGTVTHRVRDALDTRRIGYELAESASSTDVGRIVAEAAAGGARRFVSVGGDGTANAVVDALMRQPWDQPPTLGILPAGSGSDFIRTFGFPRDLESAADHLSGDETYRVDVAHVSGPWGDRYVLNAASAGLGAATVAVANKMPARLGSLRYSIGLWPALARFRPGEIEVTVGAKGFTGPALTVVFANGQFFGGGMNVAPKASLVDGLFEVLVFSGPKRQAFTVMPRVMRGLHMRHPAVKRLVGDSFSLRTTTPWALEIDGELLGGAPIDGRMVPGAINFKI